MPPGMTTPYMDRLPWEVTRGFPWSMPANGTATLFSLYMLMSRIAGGNLPHFLCGHGITEISVPIRPVSQLQRARACNFLWGQIDEDGIGVHSECFFTEMPGADFGVAPLLLRKCGNCTGNKNSERSALLQIDALDALQ